MPQHLQRHHHRRNFRLCVHADTVSVCHVLVVVVVVMLVVLQLCNFWELHCEYCMWYIVLDVQSACCFWHAMQGFCAGLLFNTWSGEKCRQIRNKKWWVPVTGLQMELHGVLLSLVLVPASPGSSFLLICVSSYLDFFLWLMHLWWASWTLCTTRVAPEEEEKYILKTGMLNKVWKKMHGHRFPERPVSIWNLRQSDSFLSWYIFFFCLQHTENLQGNTILMSISKSIYSLSIRGFMIYLSTRPKRKT